MNGYQRMMAALRGEMPDRRPVILHSFMPAAREAGYTMRQYREDPEIAAKCHIQFAEKYGVDGVLFDVDTALTAGAVGVPVDFPEDEPARTHEPLLRSLDEIDALAEVDLSKDPRIQHSLEAVKLIKKHFQGELLVRGNCDQAPFSLATFIRTPEGFMMDLMMDPERALQLLVYCAKICRQYIRLMAATGADLVSNGDSPAGPGMISPEMYAQLAAPYELQLQEEAHKAGVPYLLHICGNTELILDHMATMNLDAVDLDYQTPIRKIHETLGSHTTLCGTVDPSGVMALGTPEEVKKHTLELTNLYKGNPRLVLCSGCALPPFTPEENIRMLVRTAQESDLV